MRVSVVMTKTKTRDQRRTKDEVGGRGFLYSFMFKASFSRLTGGGEKIKKDVTKDGLFFKHEAFLIEGRGSTTKQGKKWQH